MTSTFKAQTCWLRACTHLAVPNVFSDCSFIQFRWRRLCLSRRDTLRTWRRCRLSLGRGKVDCSLSQPFQALFQNAYGGTLDTVNVFSTTNCPPFTWKMTLEKMFRERPICSKWLCAILLREFVYLLIKNIMDLSHCIFEQAFWSNQISRCQTPLAALSQVGSFEAGEPWTLSLCPGLV